MLPICSHTRTGTHYLAKLLWLNLETGLPDYEMLHFSHSRVSPAPYIHLHRGCYPTMLSLWRCRQHSGLHPSVTFAQMLRERWCDLPKAEEGKGVFNGVVDNRVCEQKPFAGTALDRWAELTNKFADRATLNIAYSFAVERPLATVEVVAAMFQVKQKPAFTPVLERVGWWSPDVEQPSIALADMQICEFYQQKVDFQCR